MAWTTRAEVVVVHQTTVAHGAVEDLELGAEGDPTFGAGGVKDGLRHVCGYEEIVVPPTAAAGKPRGWRVPHPARRFSAIRATRKANRPPLAERPRKQSNRAREPRLFALLLRAAGQLLEAVAGLRMRVERLLGLRVFASTLVSAIRRPSGAKPVVFASS
jgi:hypothetical protein